LREVMALLTDKNPAMRFLAVTLLGKVGTAGIPGLASALATNQPSNVRVAAAQALAQSGAGAAPATAALCECLSDRDPLVRWSAQQALGKVGAPAVPQLREMLKSPSLTARSTAALALGSACPPPATEVVNEMRQIAANSPPAAQPAMLAAAARLSGDSQDTQKLITLLNSPDPAVRAAAINAASELGPAGKAVETVLYERCKDPSPAVRAAAAQSLSRLAPDSPMTSQVVSRLLSDPNPDVRGAASTGLSMVSKPGVEAIQAMESAARRSDPRTACVCSSVLFRTGGSVVRTCALQVLDMT
jgi:HEAT repeat protein